MVLGWRRAFCTSIQVERERDSPVAGENSDPIPNIRTTRLSGCFSEPSTPRMQSQPVSPTLRCRTTDDPPYPALLRRLQCKTKYRPTFFRRSVTSSPPSPSTFSILKSRLYPSKSRCAICLHSVRSGQGTAIFTAECGHNFHHPCITAHMEKQHSITCPICTVAWKEMQLLTTGDPKNVCSDSVCRDLSSVNDRRGVLKVYNDDEPLSSSNSGSRFNPIPESDETEEETDVFPGFFPTGKSVLADDKMKSVEVSLLPEVAVVSMGKTSQTYAVTLKIKAPVEQVRRAPVDLVTVLNVSRNMTADKLCVMRRALQMVVSSLSADDRLSIVAFSTFSKRLLPLRRMSTTGRRLARRIFDAIVALDDAGGASSAADALKKAVKVLDDRHERNATASILLFTDGDRSAPLVTSTRFSHRREIPVHSVNVNGYHYSPPHDDTMGKCIAGLIGDVVQDLRIQLGSTPGEISAVYSYAGAPTFVGSGSSWCLVGNLYSEEERELLIELRVPSSSSGMAHPLISVQCSYKDPSTHQTICDKAGAVPMPRAVGSSTRDIQKLKCLFLTTRAVAESRRMSERGDLVGAHHMLASARALVLQSGSGSRSELVRGLEAELAELNWRMNGGEGAEVKEDPLTPTSGWRAAERLAKVAIMRKSLNRVRDLHGFENARF